MRACRLAACFGVSAVPVRAWRPAASFSMGFESETSAQVGTAAVGSKLFPVSHLKLYKVVGEPGTGKSVVLNAVRRHLISHGAAHTRDDGQRIGGSWTHIPLDRRRALGRARRPRVAHRSEPAGIGRTEGRRADVADGRALCPPQHRGSRCPTAAICLPACSPCRQQAS